MLAVAERHCRPRWCRGIPAVVSAGSPASSDALTQGEQQSCLAYWIGPCDLRGLRDVDASESPRRWPARLPEPTVIRRPSLGTVAHRAAGSGKPNRQAWSVTLAGETSRTIGGMCGKPDLARPRGGGQAGLPACRRATALCGAPIGWPDCYWPGLGCACASIPVLEFSVNRCRGQSGGAVARRGRRYRRHATNPPAATARKSSVPVSICNRLLESGLALPASTATGVVGGVLVGGGLAGAVWLSGDGSPDAAGTVVGAVVVRVGTATGFVDVLVGGVLVCVVAVGDGVGSIVNMALVA